VSGSPLIIKKIFRKENYKMNQIYNIARVRKYRGKSQQEVANCLGISLSTYRLNFEKKIKYIRYDDILKIADYLNVDIEQLKGE
jgi:transcriptional regulator with XRE-family HTH domain